MSIVSLRILKWAFISFLFGKISCKLEYCEKDEKTGLCKVEEDDDGPCWIKEQIEKEPMNERLVRLDGVKVCSLSTFLNLI